MWYNPIMIWLIRSPFHGFVSNNMMLMTYPGRKSGKVYTTPMSYIRVGEGESEYILTTSLRGRTWWRNLRGGVPVTLRLRGKDVPATAEAIEDEEAVVAELSAYLGKAPFLAKHFEVELDEDGVPNPEDLAKAAQTRVVVRTTLD